MDLEALYDIYKHHSFICTDTRSIQKDCIFFALPGANFDGNQFAYEALEKGAAYAVVSDSSLKNPNLILVEDTLDTLQSLASYHRRQFNIPLIAITGSNGKTTTKELITTVLSLKYKTHATVGNLNNHIGVPVTLLRMPPETEIAVIEMGANHIGEIHDLCEIALPTHGLITNIGKAHLEGFGSMEGVRKAKGELYDFLKTHNGYAFVNADDPALLEMGKYIIQKTSYGFNKSEAPAVLFNYSNAPENDGFIVGDELNDIIIHSKMLGRYNASNILAAYTVGMHFHVDRKLMAESLATYTPASNRSEIISHSGCTIIKDAYNANPSSMELALRAFAERYLDGWVVLGSMKELGTESENAHKHIINVLLSLGFSRIYLIGQEFISALAKVDTSDQQFIVTADSIDDLKNKWDWDQCNGTAILLKGSRSMHLERLLEN